METCLGSRMVAEPGSGDDATGAEQAPKELLQQEAKNKQAVDANTDESDLASVNTRAASDDDTSGQDD